MKALFGDGGLKGPVWDTDGMYGPWVLEYIGDKLVKL